MKSNSGVVTEIRKNSNPGHFPRKRNQLNFNSIEDIEAAAGVLREFADDAVYARLFDLSFNGESNLFFEDDDRIGDLAKRIEPDIKHEYDALSRDIQDRIVGILVSTTRAFFNIGMFVGARVADSSGETLDHLTKAWVRSTLAQPRYSHLGDGGTHNGK